MGIGSLYVDMDGDYSAKDILLSYKENRQLYEKKDKINEKCLKYVHGEHFDEDVEAQRASMGLSSLVADRTHSIWKTLDGYAKASKTDVVYIPVGGIDVQGQLKDYDGSERQNRVFTHIRKTKSLHKRQSEAFGLAAITDDSYTYIYPERNALGQIDPNFQVLNTNECYPDANYKTPFTMDDAQFVDCPMFIHPKDIEADFDEWMSPEFRESLKNAKTSQSGDGSQTGKRYIEKEGLYQHEKNGLFLVIRRFYKKRVKKKYYYDQQANVYREIEKMDEMSKQIEAMVGSEIITETAEQLWNCIIVPYVSQDLFLLDEVSDFQPINPDKLGRVRWPIIHLPFNWVGGRSVGAIRLIVKLQEARNLVISGLLNHIQNAVNGGMGYEKSAFGNDEEEERKFTEERNHPGVSIKFADGALKDGKVAPLPRGNFNFADGGDYLERILQDVMTDTSGAQKIMAGQSDKGSPASLYNMQLQQAQNALGGASENFVFYQEIIADLCYAFVRQFFTEERIMQIEGTDGKLKTEYFNAQTTMGVFNDLQQGLYTSYKSERVATESSRRRRLMDEIEVIKAMVDIGIPAWVQDLTEVIENTDSPPEIKQRRLQQVQQWQSQQGIGALAQQQQAVAQAQASQAQQRQPEPLPS